MFKNFNAEIVSQKIIKFIRSEVDKAGFKKVIVATSGGVDSATSISLAVLGLGKENVQAALLPYHNLNPASLTDGNLVLKHLAIPSSNIFKVNIGPICDQVFKQDSEMDNIRKGNVMARVRMIVLFDLAKKNKALVLGTENKSEHYLSYYTRFGDEASDIEPIRNLYKTQVRLLAKYLGVPKPIINKAPTAGLWQGQTDEGQFGFSYENADKILYLTFEKKKTVKEIVNMGYSKELIEKVLKWVRDNEFKHKLPKIANL